MHETPLDELISAYLDGELAGDELAYVERMLAEQPQARQLLDELRAVAGNVDAMPRFQLENDFHEKVLRRSEREMLAPRDGSDGDANVHPIVSGDDAATFIPRSTVHGPRSTLDESATHDRRFTRRSWIWGGVALAAGVLIMVFTSPPARENREIAKVPEDAIVRARSENEVADKSRDPLGKTARFADDSTSKLSAEGAPEESAELKFGWSKAGEKSPAAGAAGGFAPGAAGGGQAPREEAQPGTFAFDRTYSSKSDSRKGEADAALGGMGGGGGLGGRSPEPAAEPGIGLEQQTQTAAETPQTPDGVESDSAVMFVHLDVPSQANYAEHFSKLLAKQNIALEDEPDTAAAAGVIPPAPAAIADAVDVAENDEPAATDSDANANGDVEQLEKAQAAKQEKSEAARLEDRAQLSTDLKRRLQAHLAKEPARQLHEAPSQTPAAFGQQDAQGMLGDVVYVEATGEQIEAALAELNDETEMFLSLKVEPAAQDETQQQLTFYNRSNVETESAELRLSGRAKDRRFGKEDQKENQRKAKLGGAQSVDELQAGARRSLPQGIARKVSPQELAEQEALDSTDSDVTLREQLEDLPSPEHRDAEDRDAEDRDAEHRDAEPRKPELSKGAPPAGGRGLGRADKPADRERLGESDRRRSTGKRFRESKKAQQQLLPTVRYRAVFVFNEVPSATGNPEIAPAGEPAASKPAEPLPANPEQPPDP